MVTTVKKSKAPSTKAPAKAKKTLVKAKSGNTTTKITSVKAAVKPIATVVKTVKVLATKALCIDYPKSNEMLYCGHYCFRLGSARNVTWAKISINGGSWIDCRAANGYWWLDWWNFQTGNFTIEALALVDGAEVKTAKRKFKVTL